MGWMPEDQRSGDRFPASVKLQSLICLLSLAVGWTTPALSQTIPPCCTTPAIVEDLGVRPAGETDQQLRGWLSQRSRGKTEAEISLELTSLEGACATGCPANFRLAHAHLQSELRVRRQGPDTDLDSHGEPCCGEAGGSVSRPSAGRSIPTSPGRPTPVRSTAGPQFRNAVIRQLLSWTRDPEDIRGWLDPQMGRMSTDELVHLQAAVASWCVANSPCPYAMELGREIIKGAIERQNAAQAREAAAQAHREEARLRWWDWAVTVLAGFLGGLIALVGAFISTFHGRRAARRQSTLIADSVDQLNETVKALAGTRKPRPYGRRSTRL